MPKMQLSNRHNKQYRPTMSKRASQKSVGSVVKIPLFFPSFFWKLKQHVSMSRMCKVIFEPKKPSLPPERGLGILFKKIFRARIFLIQKLKFRHTALWWRGRVASVLKRSALAAMQGDTKGAVGRIPLVSWSLFFSLLFADFHPVPRKDESGWALKTKSQALELKGHEW